MLSNKERELVKWCSWKLRMCQGGSSGDELQIDSKRADSFKAPIRAKICDLPASASIIRVCRVFWIVFIIAVFTNHADMVVAKVWHAFQHCALFRHDSFEPLLATFSFGLWINVWHAVDSFIAPYVPAVQKFKIIPAKERPPPPGVPVMSFMYFHKFSAIVAYLVDCVVQ